MKRNIGFIPITYFRILVLILGSLFVSAANAQASRDVQVLLNGTPAAVGSYTFPIDATTQQNQVLVLDNGLVRFTFSRDDAAGGIVTGWTNTSITASSIIVNGVELAHNLNGVDPRDPDRQHSFYVDAGGGSSRLVCTQIKVLRSSTDLVEVAFVDNTSTPLRHEHHLIMRRDKPGLYGYDILTAVTANSISEVRNNLRWDRGIFDHSFNWERGSPDAPGTAINGQQPTYAYLATQTSAGDETWKINGINNPSLPWPDSNAGNLPAGYTYTKYNWSLYHHENPMFGHYGHGFGAWLTPLGGVTDQTLAAFYGVGPNHQDLAIHQDALILNYFGANHYGLPSYALAAGFKRLYGPWFTYVTAGDPNNPGAMIADAASIAQQEIAENRAGASWVNDPLYPTPAQRTTVTGHIDIADGRPADGTWVVLSTQNVTDVYTIHEPTYFVKTDANGNFTIPGVAPPWAAGTTNPSSYVLYAFSSKGSITEQYKQTGITFSGPTKDLGNITWTPNNRTFLWQIGKADRMGGEFALATNPADGSTPRAYEKPTLIPGTLTYNVGSSWEPKDWYYAQTNGGTWTIKFNLPRLYTGTAYFTVSTSLQSGSAPTVAVNGVSTGITGTLPNNNDSTIARQADRSGYPRLATLSFPASRLVVGANTITLTRGNGAAGGNGLGWDTLILEANETAGPPAPAQLTGQLVGITGTGTSNTVTLQVTNNGTGDANDVRLDGFTFLNANGAVPVITGRDPNRMPVPIIERIPAGGTATVSVDLDFTNAANSNFNAVIPFSANGGRARGSITASVAPVIAGTANLITTATIAKQAGGSYLATVTVTNPGSGTVQNVRLTDATLGAATGSTLPTMIGNIAPGGGTATVTVAFPASAGSSGAPVVEKFTGTYTGGTFGGSFRAVLP